MDLLTREGSEVVDSQKRDEIVAGARAIEEGATTLRQIDVIGHTEHCSHRVGVQCDETRHGGKVQGELNPHKLDILLAACCYSSIDSGE